MILTGHDKLRSGADLRGGSPLVSFDHVIDPHFVTFSSSLYTTISNPNPNANPNTNPNPDHVPNPNPNTNHNPHPNPIRNLTMITDPQIDLIDPQIVTIQIRPLRILSRADFDAVGWAAKAVTERLTVG